MKKTLLSFLGFAVVIVLTNYTRVSASPKAGNNGPKPAALSFIENKGQVTDQDHKQRTDIQFRLAAASGLNIFIGDGAIHYQFSKVGSEASMPPKQDLLKAGFQRSQVSYTMDRMDVELLGCNKHARVITEQQQPYYENYFTTGSGEHGSTAHAFNKIIYKNIYPNIDWVLYISSPSQGGQGTLKHEFVVRQGGKISDIQLKYDGAKDLKLNADGSLTAVTPQGTITEQAPDTYQKDGKKVSSSFKLANNTLSYTAGQYTGDLIIDPTLAWGTYFGGTGDEVGYSVATDATGNVYMTGIAGSATGIATTGAYQTVFGGATYDAFLAKFNSSGARLWATYYGGSGDDYAFSVATDPTGNVYIGGRTNSTSGLSTGGGYQPAYGGGSDDAFLAKFATTGAIAWATYYGGPSLDGCTAIAMDNFGHVYLSGTTYSTSGISTPASFQPVFGGTADMFLVQFDAASGSRNWATYYGDANNDNGYCATTDAFGNVYIGGQTTSVSGLATSGAYQGSNGGGFDGMIVQFDVTGARLWATYFGGTGFEQPNGMVADGAGNLFVTGQTSSIGAIATAGAHQFTFGGGTYDGFLVQFNNAGARQWATYYGGSGTDYGNSLTVDGFSNVYMGGQTASSTGIASATAYQPVFGGSGDCFVAEFSNAGSRLYGTYYGGANIDGINGLVYNGSGSLYVTGSTSSVAAIATAGAYQLVAGGSVDAFLAKFDTCNMPVVSAITGTAIVCPNNTVTLSDATGGGVWTSDNNTVATISATGVVTGVTEGIVAMSYSVTNGCGTTSVELLVNVGGTITVSTIAGTGTAGSSGDGGLATAALLTVPHCIWVDVIGNRYIGDNHRIRKINPSGIISTIAGTGIAGFSGDGAAATAATMQNPFSIVTDAAGNVYFTDNNNHRVRKINSAGIISTIVGDGTPAFFGDGGLGISARVNSPCGLAFDVAGNLYIGDGANHRIRKLNTSGIISTYAGTGTPGYSGDGGQATLAQLNNPNFVRTDRFDNLYLSDNSNNCVRVVSPTGVITTFAGNGTAGYLGDGSLATAARLNSPGGITIDGVGNVFIAGVVNQAIRMVNPAGIISTYAGTGSAGYSGDGGAPLSAKFNFPVDVTVDNFGSLLIADISNNVIRKVAPANATLTPITGATVVCKGSVTVLTETGTGGSWTSSATSVASVGSTGEVTGVAVGTAVISYSATYTCGTVIQAKTIAVLPTAAAITGAATVCPGNTIALTETTTGGVWSSSNTAFATVSGGIVTGVSAGNVVISYTMPGGCGAAIVVAVGNSIISTIAGGGASLGDGGPATSGSMSQPTNIYIDAAGNKLVSEFGGSRVRQISPAGIITTIAGNGTAASGGDGGLAVSSTVNQPAGVCKDAAGNIYIAEQNGCRIRKINTAGIISLFAGTGSCTSTGDGSSALVATVNHPTGVAADASGNVYIAEWGGGKVRKVNSSGIISTVAGGGVPLGDGGLATAASLSGPYGISLDGYGNLYIGDQSHNRIRMVDLSTNIITTVAGNGSGGYTADGVPATSSQINTPCGVYADGYNLYIADAGNSRVRRVERSTGLIYTSAGIGTAGFSGDGGSPATAKLNTPAGVMLDAAGNLYVADYSNSRIRMVNQVNPVVTPVSGLSTLCEGSTTTFTDATINGVWSSSNTGVASVGSGSGVVTGVAGGTAVITYSVTYSCGVLFQTQSLTVNPLPVTGTITGVSSLCIGGTATLADAAGGGVWSSTNTAAATITSSGDVTAVASGTTTISYSVTNGCGMRAATLVLTVNPLPSAIAGSPTVCIGSNVTLTDPSGPGTWLSGNTGVATIGSGTGTLGGVTAGTSIITFTLTATGCSTTQVQTVYALPSAISGAAALCAGSTVTLTDPSGAGTWVSSNTSTATVVSGTGVVSGVAAGTTTITFTLTSTGCTATRTESVNGSPSAISGPASVCVGSTVTLTDPTGAGTWLSGSTGVGTVGGGTGTVGGVSAGTTIITFTLTSTGCTVTRVQTVNALPAAIGGATSVCVLATTTLTDVSGVGTWVSSNTGTATIGAATGTVGGVAAGTTTITFTLTATGCSITSTETVNPLPVAGSITGSTPVCPTATITLSDAAGGGVWSSVTTAVATISATGVVTGVTAGTTTISYTVTNGCGTAVATTIVTVSPTPVAGSITGTASVCAGSTTTLSDAAGGGVWSSVTTAVATVSATGIVNGVSAGTSTISYTVTNSCGTAVATRVATVNPLPVAGSITGATTLCATLTTTLSDAAGGGVWSSTNTATATISATGLVTAVAAGTTTISYTVTNGCGTAVATTVFTVNPLPVAGSITGTPAVCAGSTTTFADAAGGGIWSSVSTAVATVTAAGIVTGVSSGTSTISYTVTNSCGTAVATRVATVNPLPVSGTITGTTTLCATFSTTLTDAAGGGVWSSTNTAAATISATGVVTAVAAGTTTISYTVTNSCGTAVATVVFTVNPLPVAGSITGTATVCATLTTTLADAAGGGVWSSVATAVATVNAAGAVTGVSSGTSTISYTVTNSCGTAVATRIVTVNPLPVSGSITGTTTLCPAVTTTLVDAAGGGIWSSTTTGVATVSAAGVVTAVTAGTTTISYTVSNSCGTVAATTVVTVNPAPVAGTVTGTAVVCPATTTTLANVAGGGVWSSTNTAVATIDVTGLVTGVAAGTTTISYTVTNSCGTAVATRVVTTNPLPVAGAITGLSNVCVGAPITLTDPAGGGVWSSSNTAAATVSAAGVVNAVSTGTAIISYNVTNSCGTAVAIHAVNTFAAPVAGTIIGASTVCAGTYTVFVDALPGGIWSMTNSRATITGTGLLTGITPGLDTISYAVTNICGTATTTKIVNIGPLLTVGAISGPSSVCVGSAISLTDTSTTGTWSSSYTSMATVSTSGMVTALSGGLDTIYYTVTSGCGAAIAVHLVNVIPIPTGGTISGPAAVCAGMTATYTTTATGGIWGTSNATATINSFGLLTAATPGPDTVLYVETNACGSATSVLPMVIGPALTVGPISGGTTLCQGSTLTLTDATTGGIWSTSNISASVTGGLVTGLSAGIDTIGYTVTSSCGSVIATHTITVNPLPDAGTISGPANVCAGATITLTDAAAGGFWTASNARATVAGGVVTGMSAGLVVISYTVINSCGTAVATKTITVGTVPTAGTITGPGNVCVGSAIILTDATTGGVWTRSNSSATVTGGTVTGLVMGVDTIYYSVITSCGTATTSATVSVNPLPAAGSILGSSVVCTGSSVFLTSTVAGGAWSVTNANAAITSAGSLTGVTAGIDTVVYTNVNSCGTATATSVMTVNAMPAAGAISGPAAVCIGASVVLTDAATGGVWTATNANAAVIGGTVTGAITGTDTIAYTVTNACGTAAASAVITINPLPDAGTVTGPASVCSGATVAFTDPVTGGVWTSAAPAIASVSASGIVTGGTPGLTTIVYTITSSCGIASAATTVNVLALPDAGVITGASNVCPGSAITLTSTVSGGAWSSANTHASVTSGVVTGVSAGADTILYSFTNACGTATASKTLTIHPLPNAGTIVGAASVCAGAFITLGESVAGGTWSITNARATISVAGLVTGIAAGIDTVHYTFTNACGNAVAVKVITVDATPAAGTITGASDLCIGASTTLTNPVAGGVWSSSNAAVASVTTAGVVMGRAAGTASINYTMNNGCGAAIATHSVVVLPLTDCNTLVHGVSNQNDELKVYPNPSEGVFAMNLLSENKTAVHVVITSIVGQQTNEYTTETNTELMIHLNQPAGTYLLSASTAYGKWVTKFTIR